MSLFVRLLLLTVSIGSLAAYSQEKRVIPQLSGTGRKVALVVGNKDYLSHPLTNPLNDADDVKQALTDIGFTVEMVKNANNEEFHTRITRFARSLQEGDTVIFYYSGHGIALENQNYLIPVDFNVTTEESVAFHSVNATEVQRLIVNRKPQLAILVLDACRDNPFIRTKGIANGGLVPMTAAKGTLIAFAAGQGEAAVDSANERNSLYTKYLLGALKQPGLSVRELFQQVKVQVHEASGEKILPSIDDGLIGDLVFRPVDPTIEEGSRRFAAIKDAKDPALFEAFIGAFPTHPQTPEARTRLDQLNLERQKLQQQAEQARLRKDDDDFWTFVKDSPDPAVIDLYTSRYPSGSHQTEAATLRAQLVIRKNEAERQKNAQQFQSKDDDRWTFARSTNSRQAVEKYLQDFPTGSHVSEAQKMRDAFAIQESETTRQQIAQLSRAQDETAWEMASKAKSKPVLEAYLEKFSLHAAEARDMIAKLPEERVDKAGGVPGNPHLPYRNPRDHSEYVWVPGGTFQAGCRENDAECGPDEPRHHTVTLPDAGFWMGQTEVTVQAYKLFVEANKRKMPSPSDDNRKWEFTDHPMIKVSWEQAKDYCTWVGGRLPTGDEWERAARGGTDTRYPWGDRIQANQAKYTKTAQKTGAVTAPVKSFEPNGYGLYDEAGNVWEWTTDVGPKGVHQTRGGSWYSAAKDLHVTSIRVFKSDEGINEVGFRCLLPQLPMGVPERK